jgi:GntR family transcriptional repressor for pyruvate dehydrogenase complex
LRSTLQVSRTAKALDIRQMSQMIYSQIKHDKTSREIERQIESLILEGVLRSGDKLPGERELSKSFNVSRPIVRQALSALEEGQLLVTRHGGGTYVADVIGTVFAPPIVKLIGSNKKAKSDYLEYRRELEGITAAMAAQRATEADKALLSRIMDEMQEAHQSDNPRWESRVDVEFHSTIGECAHNVILLHTLRSCYRLLSDDVFYNRERIYGGNGAREKLLQQHRAIFDCVMSGDSNGASQAAHDHIRFVEQATREVDQKVDWSVISELRLAQRGGVQKPKSPRSKPSGKSPS